MRDLILLPFSDSPEIELVVTMLVIPFTVNVSCPLSHSSHMLACIITLAISKCYGKVRVLFFPRDNSLISRGNSHVSLVRGLVVRCLLFNPEVSCSNPWVCANFFTSIPKQKVLTFFGTMRLFGFVRLFFGFATLFFRNF